MTEVIMPKMGDAMEEGTLVEWLKKEGESVKSGEIIGTIQTDKATLELESPDAGVLAGFLIQPGDTVPVGVPIAAILKGGEKLPPKWGDKISHQAELTAEKKDLDSEKINESRFFETKSQDRLKMTPLAKKIAKEKQIDLTKLKGTGPDGRITEKDVLSITGKEESMLKGVENLATSLKGDTTKIPLNRLRQITAQRTQQSKQQIPHFYVTVEVDLEKIAALRSQFESEQSGKVSINDFVVKASALALKEMPEVNSSFAGKELIQYADIHVGIAAAVPEGLMVPVIKNASRLTLREIASVSKELVRKARENKLHPEEMSGSTFSISNMGMLDVDHFVAIINPPNCAIVAISSARKKVVVNEEDELEIRLRMNITGSFDHRVVDGAGGAKFINILKSYLENPSRLVN